MILKLRQKRPSFIGKTIFEVAQKWNAGQKTKYGVKKLCQLIILQIFLSKKKHKTLIDKNI